MCHHWAHPSFSTPETLANDTSPSERWLRQFAERSELSYNTLMDGASMWIQCEDYLCLGGLLEGKHVPDEFWTHYETVTGKKGSGNFFTCSC